MFRLFTPLFAELDRISMAFTRDVSSRLIVAITPVLSIALTIWFITWGVLVMRGVVQQPVRDFLEPPCYERAEAFISAMMPSATYSASAVMVSDGLTPSPVGTIEASAT